MLWDLPCPEMTIERWPLLLEQPVGGCKSMMGPSILGAEYAAPTSTGGPWDQDDKLSSLNGFVNRDPCIKIYSSKVVWIKPVVFL